jgi:hypothetical protein
MRLAPPQRSGHAVVRGDAVDVGVIRADDDEGVRDQVARQEGVEGVTEHRLAADADVLLGRDRTHAGADAGSGNQCKISWCLVHL